MQKGIVKKSTGSWYEILDAEGQIIESRIKGKFRLEGKKTTNPIAVGDEVMFSVDPKTGNGLIEELIQRKNYIIRKANNLSRQQHIIASNLDQVIIMATLAYPRTSQGFIDRVLATAEAYEIKAIIFFNKKDIYLPEMLEQMEEMTAMYRSLGYESYSLSVKTGENIPLVNELIEGKTSLITGHSGVGKSSLLNALIPDLKLKTGGISISSMKGTHTTTFAEMHVIDLHTFIIDTPGIKEFGLVEMEKVEISHFFPEMRAYLGQCRFTNCLHIDEPGCAILEALEEGKIYPSRYESYLSMLANEDTHR